MSAIGLKSESSSFFYLSLEEKFEGYEGETCLLPQTRLKKRKTHRQPTLRHQSLQIRATKPPATVDRKAALCQQPDNDQMLSRGGPSSRGNVQHCRCKAGFSELPCSKFERHNPRIFQAIRDCLLKGLLKVFTAKLKECSGPLLPCSMDAT